MLGYVLAYRPLTLDGSLVTSAGRRFFFTAGPNDTMLRGGDWVHFEPLPGPQDTNARARIVARADQVAAAWVAPYETVELLAALAGEPLSARPA